MVAVPNYFGKLYREIYSKGLLTPQRTRREAEFARKTLDLKRADRVLDLACGFMRHARLLAKTCSVVAVDNNCDYLKSGRGMRAKTLVPICADMRALPFADKTFQASLLLFNSFGYFAATGQEPLRFENGAARQTLMWKLPGVFYERELVDMNFGQTDTRTIQGADNIVANTQPQHGGDVAVVQEIVRVLKPGGSLLIEIPNAKMVITAVMRAPRQRLAVGKYEIEEEFSYNPSTRILNNRTVFRSGKREETGSYTLRLYTPEEMKSLLKKEELHIAATFGSYNGDKFLAHDSETLIIHASKR